MTNIFAKTSKRIHLRALAIHVALLVVLILFAFTLIGSTTHTPLAPTPTPLGGGHGQIAFVSSRDGFDEIYVMNTDGSRVQRLTSSLAENWSPTWSPNGKQFAFASDQDVWRIDTMYANGSEQEQLTLTSDLFWDVATFEKYPAWSPDGRFVMFQSNRDGSENIYVINVTKHGVRRLTFEPGDHLTPTWAPNERAIAYVTDRNYQDDIYVRAISQGDYPALYDSQSPRNLTNHLAWYGSPGWSPDGKRILFASDRDGNSEIYTIKVDGTDLRRLTYNPANDMQPAWSPDGSQIAFVSERDGNQEIYLMNADGSHVRRLTHNLADDGSPAWRP